MRLFWLSMMMLVAVLSAAAWLLPTSGEPHPLDPVIPGTLHAAIVFLSALSLIVRSKMLSDARLVIVVRDWSAAEAPGPEGSADVAPGIRTPDISGAIVRWMWPAFFLGWIVNLIILLAGLALAVEEHRPAAIIPFAFVSFALNVLMYPRVDPYLRRAERLLSVGTGLPTNANRTTSPD